MKILITGVSSGIGLELTKQLINKGHTVWGISRNRSLHSSLKKELKNSSRLFLTKADLNATNTWNSLIIKMKKQRFTPSVVIFNAALHKNDLSQQIHIGETRLMMETNFFSILEGINQLKDYIPAKAQFIAISSSSALKGNANEGIGYSASKAALSLAFETLQQKFSEKYLFTTVSLGPVNTGMSRIPNRPLSLSASDAANKIIKAIKDRPLTSENPGWLFLLIKLIKLLPPKFQFYIFSTLEKIK